MAASGRHDPDPEAARKAADFIRAHLPLTEVPGTGVRLHLAGPRSGLSRLVAPGGTPYWAHAWPGGVALATHIARTPGLVEGRYVHEIGTGSGLVSIAAARVRPRTHVIGLDVDPLAAVAVRLNAEANGVGPRVETFIGPRHHAGPILGPVSVLVGTPVILVADMFYDEAIAARVTASLDAQSRRALILVGDIGRRFLPLDRLEPLASYPVRDLGDPPTAPLRDGRVFRWTPRP